MPFSKPLALSLSLTLLPLSTFAGNAHETAENMGKSGATFGVGMMAYVVGASKEGDAKIEALKFNESIKQTTHSYVTPAQIDDNLIRDIAKGSDKGIPKELRFVLSGSESLQLRTRLHQQGLAQKEDGQWVRAGAKDIKAQLGHLMRHGPFPLEFRLVITDKPAPAHIGMKTVYQESVAEQLSKRTPSVLVNGVPTINVDGELSDVLVQMQRENATLKSVAKYPAPSMSGGAHVARGFDKARRTGRIIKNVGKAGLVGGVAGMVYSVSTAGAKELPGADHGASPGIVDFTDQPVNDTEEPAAELE